MKKINTLLNQLSNCMEALKPSQYRDFVKGWDKSKHKEIFQKYTDDPKAYRIYIPVIQKETPEWLSSALEQEGYKVKDYLKGIAQKEGDKREFKIGKVLSQIDKKNNIDVNSSESLTRQYREKDHERRINRNEQDYLIVISRHPYDIAGASTDRAWKSCMTLPDPKKKIPAGAYCNTLKGDVEYGSLIAYLINPEDTNIEKPIARVLIKPFENFDTHEVFYLVEPKVYRNAPHFFRTTVIDWVNKNYPQPPYGLYKVMDGLYSDKINRVITQTTKGIEINGTPLQDMPEWFVLVVSEWIHREFSIDDIEVETDQSGDGIEWSMGTWHGGEWEEGMWLGGTWSGGTWKRGLWESGEWKQGHWMSGVWNDGIWNDGIWHGESEEGGENYSVWKYGTWHDGAWYGGIWESGCWKGGTWENGTWQNGTWEDGDWRDGIWMDGTWYNGVWDSGSWEGGEWKNGDWFDGTWSDGTWHDGTWSGGTWLGGTWYGGTWEDGDWEIGNIKSEKYSSVIEDCTVNPSEFKKLEKQSESLEELKELVQS